MAEASRPVPTGSAFTPGTQRLLTAMRVTAYSMATCFMIVMVIRGVWITRGEMEAAALRSQRSAEIALSALPAATTDDRARAQALLRTIAPPHVRLRLEPVQGPPPSAASPDPAAAARDHWTASAVVDHQGIWHAALAANVPYILFVLALGLPTIAIFLYMGWLVNRPALQMLAFAQASGDEVRDPPQLPRIWHSVIARLTQLREQQRQMQAFLDNAPFGMIFFTADGRVTMMNDFGAAYFGESPETMRGKDLAFFARSFSNAEDLARSLFTQTLETGETATLETVFNGAIAAPRTFRITSFPVHDPDRRIELVGMFVVDVTEQRKAETELSSSQALFEAFIANAPNPMALMDTQGRYHMINVAAAGYFADTPEALLAADVATINARFPEADTVIRPMFARVCQNRAFEQVTTLFRLTSGELREFNFSLFPILDAEGKLAYVGNISHDVTDERQARAALIASRDALHQSEKLAALGSLLAGVSHELNNPLAAVIGQAALLSEDLENTEHADRIAKIKRAADRCARIVQSFLAMARQKAPEYRSIDINDQVRSAVELTEYQMRAANVTLKLEAAANLPLIRADPDQLHQVIVNLLTNARQALEEKDGERVITITSSARKNSVRLAVADNGPGIDAATRDRLFDPFFTTKAAGKGTGIGLSYSLGIVEAHGGTITIEDAAVGTVFVITLPIETGTQGTAPLATAAPASVRGQVLIIDDEPDVAETLADMLERMGMTAKVAIGGLAGQEAMRGAATYDLVLSDIRMPDCDGPTLHAWIAANRPDLAERIAFVTGDTLSGIAADFLDVTRCPVLEKPFTPAALRELVSAMLPGTLLQS